MSVETKTKVVIVDDHAIVREGIAKILEHSGDFEVVDQAADGDAALEQVRELAPDVVIMDILMPVKGGIESCREITESVPGTRVLMLTASNDQNAIAQSVSAGATGYLQKYSGKELLLATVREVAAGEFRVQGEAARRFFAGLGGEPAPVPPSDLNRLTAREREVLRMFASGMSYAEIGEARGNQPMSVRNAVYAIQRKLGLRTRQEMGVWAVRSGLLDDELH